MEKYLKEIISQKGLSEAYKECIHMIESLMNTASCYKSDTEKLKTIKSLIEPLSRVFERLFAIFVLSCDV